MALDVKSGKSLTFQNYQIVITKGKYGVVDKNGNNVIECVFDNIEWLTDDNLVKFCLSGKYAVCIISDIEKIKII